MMIEVPPTISRARYAKGKFVMTCPGDGSGYKTRAARLAVAFGGRWGEPLEGLCNVTEQCGEGTGLLATRLRCAYAHVRIGQAAREGFADSTERIFKMSRAVLSKDQLLAELKAARRVGISSLGTMQANVTAHLKCAAECFKKEWTSRHPKLSLRSLEWPEPRRTAVAARWDDYDRAQHAQNKIAARKNLRKHVAEMQCARQILAWLGPWVADDSTVYLRWRNDPRYHNTIGILDAAGNVVAEVYRAGGPGPTIRAVIYAPPFTQSPSIALYDRGGHHNGIELAWGMFRQRKSGVAWLIDEVHKRCYAIWQNEIDLPASESFR